MRVSDGGGDEVVGVPSAGFSVEQPNVISAVTIAKKRCKRLLLDRALIVARDPS